MTTFDCTCGMGSECQCNATRSQAGSRAANFYVEAGRMRRKVGRFWIPDGLHLWWRSRGVRVFWSSWPPIGFDHDPDWNRHAL